MSSRFETNHIYIATGPFVVRISVKDDVLATEIAARYATFQTTGHPFATLEVHVHRGKNASCISRYRPVRRGDAFVWKTRTCRLVIFPQAGKGVLEGMCPHPGAAVEYALRCLVALTAWRYDAVLLHASAVVLHRQAALFVGPSGTGKSTIARLRPSGTHLLGDDLVLLHSADVVNWVWATPFVGEAAPTTTGPYPMGRVYVPIKDTAPAAVPIPASLGFAYMMQALPLVPLYRPALRAVRRTFETLLHRVPVNILRFAPTPSFWPLVLSALEDDSHGS